MAGGSRYGNFSSFRAEPPETTALYKQQGQIEVEADWNRQVELDSRRLDRTLQDLLGRGAAPADNAGFYVRPVVAVRFEDEACATAALGDVGATFNRSFLADVRWSQGDGVLFTEAIGDDHWMVSIDNDGCVGVLAVIGGNEVSVFSDVALPAGVFCSVGVLCDGIDATIVLDGVVIGAGSFDVEPTELGESNIWFGTRPGHRIGSGVRVDLSGAQLYSEALSIDDLSLAPTEAAIPESMIAWWPMDHGSGGSLREVVASRNAVFAGVVPPRWDLIDLDIQPGRYYVEGVPADRPHVVRFRDQLTAPNQHVPTRPGDYLVVLESWDRSVQAVADPAMLDPALPGVETTVRSETVAAVRIVENPASGGDASDTSPSGQMLAIHEPGHHVANALYRIEVHRSGTVSDDAEIPPRYGTLVERIDVERSTVWLAEPISHLVDGDLVSLVAPSIITEGVVTFVDERVVRVGEVSRSALEALAESSEVVLAEADPTPTFVWSRTNGSTVAPVLGLSPNGDEIELLGDSDPQFPVGSLIELIDSASEYSPVSDRIRRVVEVTPGCLAVDQPFTAPFHEAASSRAFIRRWDTPADGTHSGGAVAVVPDLWLPIERGISVCFTPGTYRRGDYWWITARTALDGIEWPQDEGVPALCPPDGIHRRVAPLASLTIDDDGVQVRDLRCSFAPVAVESDDLGPADPEPVGTPPVDKPVPVDEPPGGSVPNSGRSGDGHQTRWLAQIAPVGHTPAGYRDLGLTVATTPRWHTQVAIDPPPERVRQLVVVAATREHDQRVALISDDAIAIVDPSSGRCDTVSGFPSPRQGFGAAALGDLIVIAGGHAPGERPDGGVWAFDVTSGRWSQRAPLPKPVAAPAVAARNGSLHCVGGTERRFRYLSLATKHHQVYDPSSDEWTEAEPAPARSVRSAAAATDDGIHVLGGRGRWLFGRSHLTRHLRWSDGWSTTVELPHRLESLSASGIGDQLVIAGVLGDRGHVFSQASYGSPWEASAPVPSPTNELVSVVRETQLVAVVDSERVSSMAVPGQWQLVERC